MPRFVLELELSPLLVRPILPLGHPLGDPDGGQGGAARPLCHKPARLLKGDGVADDAWAGAEGAGYADVPAMHARGLQITCS